MSVRGPLGVTPDGTNINQDCGSTSPQVMCNRVREVRADFGIALDGDADRVVMADEQGRIIDGGTNRRLTSIPLQVPAEAVTVGAAVGRAKVAAIRAALKGRLINGLITDEATAGAVLKP